MATLHKKYSVKLLLLLLVVVLVTHHFMAGVLTQSTQRSDMNSNSNSQALKTEEDCDHKIPLTSENQKGNSIVTEKIQKTTDNHAVGTERTAETGTTLRYATTGLCCLFCPSFHLLRL